MSAVHGMVPPFSIVYTCRTFNRRCRSSANRMLNSWRAHIAPYFYELKFAVSHMRVS